MKYWKKRKQKTLPSSKDRCCKSLIHKSKGLALVVMIFCNWDINGKINTIFWVLLQTPSTKLQSIPLKYISALGHRRLPFLTTKNYYIIIWML
ncbi:hypothetical protein CS542_08550 [Pedobacter sp. IW39]|nr:hypothetical protein CS542_08550 [Pedobacter sp. IW39]